MTRDDFVKSIEETYAKGVEIVRIKNQDYAGDNNPFKNFESAAVAGVGISRAIIVRILDKLSRISNIIDKDRAVKDETIEDTILDAINYLAILKAYLENGSK